MVKSQPNWAVLAVAQIAPSRRAAIGLAEPLSNAHGTEEVATQHPATRAQGPGMIPGTAKDEKNATTTTTVLQP